MSMTKSNNSRIMILITCTISINIRLVYPINIMRDCICIWTQLYHSKRNTCPRKGMPHAICSNNRIDFFNLGNCSCGICHNCCQPTNLLSIHIKIIVLFHYERRNKGNHYPLCPVLSSVDLTCQITSVLLSIVQNDPNNSWYNSYHYNSSYGYNDFHH